MVQEFKLTPEEVGAMTEAEIVFYTSQDDNSDVYTSIIRAQVLESLSIEDRIELARRKYGLDS